MVGAQSKPASGVGRGGSLGLTQQTVPNEVCFFPTPQYSHYLTAGSCGLNRT